MIIPVLVMLMTAAGLVLAGIRLPLYRILSWYSW